MTRKISQYIKLVALAIFIPALVLAHAEPETQATKTKAIIVEPDLFVAKTSLPIWLEITDTEDGEKITGLDVKIDIENAAEQIISTSIAIQQGDLYVFEPVFPSGGDYTIHAEFSYQNEEQDFHFPIFVSEPESQETTIIVILVAAGIAIVLLIIFLGLKKKNWKTAIIWSLIVLVLAGLAYSLRVALQTGPWIITCPTEGTCFATAHIHAYVPIWLCGEDYRLPIEVGRLDGPHTHEEKNIIHWHDKLPYDAVNQKLMETAPLTLGVFFDAMQIHFDQDGIADKRNGDACPDGTTGTLKVFVNGVLPELASMRDWIWRDKEVISIFFDGRTVAEILEALKNNPVAFPKLGRG